MTQISETLAPNPITHRPCTPSLPYLSVAIQSSQVQPKSFPTMVHYIVERNHQLRVQIYHKTANTSPSYTQAWIDNLYQDMVSNTLLNIEEFSRNILGYPWDKTLIPFHEKKVGVPTITFFTNRHVEKDPEEESNGLSWSNRRAILDRANFST